MCEASPRFRNITCLPICKLNYLFHTSIRQSSLRGSRSGPCTACSYHLSHTKGMGTGSGVCPIAKALLISRAKQVSPPGTLSEHDCTSSLPCGSSCLLDQTRGNSAVQRDNSKASENHRKPGVSNQNRGFRLHQTCQTDPQNRAQNRPRKPTLNSPSSLFDYSLGSLMHTYEYEVSPLASKLIS